MGGYSDFIVSFIREYVDEENKTKNVTVGRCSSSDRHPLEHRGMRIYYNATTKSIVMELPATIDQQDTGSYYCDVKIRNAESNELILHGNRMAIIDIDSTSFSEPTSPRLPMAAIAIPVIVVIMIVVVAAVVLVGALMYIKRQPQHNKYDKLAGASKEF